MEKFVLNQMHLDVLKEVGSIGTSHAVTSLSVILNKKVGMGLPKVSLVDFNEVSNFVGGAESIVAGILVHLSGDINGMMMFLTEERCCKPLVSELFGGTGMDFSGEGADEAVLSALSEVGNILAGAYLSSFADLIQKKIRPSAPLVCIDMAQAILSVPAIEFGKISDKVLLIESVFKSSDMDISGYFLLIPDFESFKTIFSSLGV